MSSIMRWRSGLMGLSDIAKTPVSHGVEPHDFETGPGLRVPLSAHRPPAAHSPLLPLERFSPNLSCGRRYRSAGRSGPDHRSGMEGGGSAGAPRIDRETKERARAWRAPCVDLLGRIRARG